MTTSPPSPSPSLGEGEGEGENGERRGEVCGSAIYIRSIPPLLAKERGPGGEVVPWDGSALLQRAGGITKLGDIILESTVNELSAAAILDACPREIGPSCDFGLTIYGGSKSQSRQEKELAMALKKELKSRGVSSRWVTSEGGEPVSPAAVEKLGLTDRGLDVCVLKNGERVFVGLTTHVQSADAWSERDFGRPGRDSRSGTLRRHPSSRA